MISRELNMSNFSCAYIFTNMGDWRQQCICVHINSNVIAMTPNESRFQNLYLSVFASWLCYLILMLYELDHSNGITDCFRTSRKCTVIHKSSQVNVNIQLSRAVISIRIRIFHPTSNFGALQHILTGRMNTQFRFPVTMSRSIHSKYSPPKWDRMLAYSSVGDVTFRITHAPGHNSVDSHAQTSSQSWTRRKHDADVESIESARFGFM